MTEAQVGTGVESGSGVGSGTVARGRSPWYWVPTLYFAEGIPYFIVNTISVIMFKNMGMSNADVAMYTGLLYLPWVVKPLWSPFVDIIRTKRWWIILCQAIVTASLILAAASIPRGGAGSPDGLAEAAGSLAGLSGAAGSLAETPTFALTLAIFWITAFASATHDIAADGFYMLALDSGRQSLFVGIRSTFYRLSSVFGQGVLVVVAGVLERRTENIPLAWTLTLLVASLIFLAITVYHVFFLPRPVSDRGRLGTASSTDSLSSPAAAPSSAGAQPSAPSFRTQAKEIFREFGRTFVTFFRKKGVLTAMIFMLLYRLPEALLLKMLNPFLLDPVSEGGLGLSTETVGIVYGTIGVIALTIGGILGGMAASKWGLKKVLWPMALSLALPCSVYLFMSLGQPTSLWTINFCIALDQFGYGFGFTAYMLYMMYFAEGEFKTSHYSLCTAFMALSMMLPGMIAGYLQEWLGYRGFFGLVVVCCLVTVLVTLFVRVDPNYGKSVKKE